MSITMALMSLLTTGSVHAVDFSSALAAGNAVKESTQQTTQDCAAGDLRCDFSATELREALGLPQEQQIDPAWLQENQEDQWVDEELEGGHDIETAEEQIAIEDQESDMGALPVEEVSRRRGRAQHFYPSKRHRATRPQGSDSHKTDSRGMPQERAPIWASFISNFKSCAPGCIPANYGTYGGRNHNSCHPSGKAVDVGAIVCGGTTYKAISGGRFATFVGCMSGKMKTLYRNGKGITLGHHDHAHFSNGCKTDKGGATY